MQDIRSGQMRRGFQKFALDAAGQHKKVILENVRTHKRRTVTAKYIVNAAGLSAQTVAQSLGARKAAIPRQYLAKGNYFTLKGIPVIPLMSFHISN